MDWDPQTGSMAVSGVRLDLPDRKEGGGGAPSAIQELRNDDPSE